MAKKRVTIYDVAKVAEVSASTVSRVLNDSKHPVEKNLREKVLNVAKELDYIPNAQARFLKKKNTEGGTIGIILPSIDNPAYPSYVKGMQDVATQKGYQISICGHNQNENIVKNYLERLSEISAEGIITLYLDFAKEEIEKYLSRGGKVVSIGTKDQFVEKALNYVVDFENQTYMATKHLIELGHRKIAYITSKIDTPLRRERLSGFKKCLKEHDINFDENIVFECMEKLSESTQYNTDCQVGVLMTEKLLECGDKPTAIVCMNDLVAFGSLSVLQQKKYSIPKDFSIVGFDDVFFTPLTFPPLTTVKTDRHIWGQTAVNSLINIIEENNEPIKPLQKEELLIRQSTRKL